MSAGSGIREAEPRDGARLAAIYEPHVSTGLASFELIPPDADEMTRRLATVRAAYPWLVYEEAGTVAGYVYASQSRPRAAYQWNVDVTVYVDEAYHRRGIAAALYTSLFALLRVQGFYNAYAGITLPNMASVTLHESFGFKPVGVYAATGYKKGAWWDTGWWELALRPKEPTPPATPLTPETARLLPAWEQAVRSGLPLLRPGAD